jgi:hypothetical protein
MPDTAHILPFRPGEAFPAATGTQPVFRLVEPPGPTMAQMHAEVYRRLAAAEREGRAALDPAQTALAVEVATAAYRMGCEQAGEVIAEQLAALDATPAPAPFFHR